MTSPHQQWTTPLRSPADKRLPQIAGPSGMVIFGVIISGFTFLRLDAYYQEMIKGVIIVAAVVADTYRQKKRRKS